MHNTTNINIFYNISASVIIMLFKNLAKIKKTLFKQIRFQKSKFLFISSNFLKG